MASGRVKWFDNRRGYGFITQNSGVEIFVHHSSIMGGSEYKTLDEGEEVFFEVLPGERGLKAINVQRTNFNNAQTYRNNAQTYRHVQRAAA
jgi:CspA family cold shock protein